MRLWLWLVLWLIPGAAFAGPPFITDDPEPVDLHHTETFFYTAGSSAGDGIGGASGIDFNYGFMPQAHFNLVLPVAYDSPKGDKTVSGLGNIELAVKYRFYHRDGGWHVAVYPRLILPSASHDVGDNRSAVFLPLWLQRDGDGWSTFGGGGCVLHHGGGARNYCLTGWAVTRDLSPRWHAGVEIVHQTASETGGRATTAIGAGLTYDINDHYHLMTYAGPNLQNVPQTARYSWYAALQVTY